MQALTIIKPVILGLSLTALTGCGGGGSSNSGGEPAGACVDQVEVGPSTIDVTNTCDRTIILVVSGGRRFVIAPNDVNRIDMVGPQTGIAACFSPSEPDFDGGILFTCQ